MRRTPTPPATTPIPGGSWVRQGGKWKLLTPTGHVIGKRTVTKTQRLLERVGINPAAVATVPLAPPAAAAATWMLPGGPMRVIPGPNQRRAFGQVNVDFRDAEKEDAGPYSPPWEEGGEDGYDYGYDAGDGFETDAYDEEDIPFYSEAPWDEYDLEGYMAPLMADGTVAGLLDEAASWWKSQYDRAVAQLQAYVGAFLQNKDKLYAMKDLAAKAIAAGQGRQDIPPAAVERLKDLADDVDDALEKQVSLEGQVKDTISRIRMTNDAGQQGVGVIPFVVGAVAVTAIATVGGLAYMHTRHVNELQSELDLAARGVLTPDQIARIKSAGGFLGGVESALSTGFLLLLLGGGAWWYFKRGRKR